MADVAFSQNGGIGYVMYGCAEQKEQSLQVRNKPKRRKRKKATIKTIQNQSPWPPMMECGN